MKTKFFIIFILSLFFYLIAPMHYSLNYCILLLSIFLFCSIFFLRKTKGVSYFNFHMLFLTSMLFVNFIYPVFLRPIDIAYFPVFNISFNENLITKATALVLLGTTSYMFGALSYKNKKNNNIKIKENNNVLNNYLKQFLIFFSYFLFFLFLLFVGDGFFKGIFSSYSKSSIYVLTIFLPVFYLTVIVYVLNMKGKKKMDIISYLRSYKTSLIIILIVFIFTFLFVGDRGPVMDLIIIIIGLYTYLIRPLKLKSILPLMIFGMFTLTTISYTRTTDSKQSRSINHYLGRVRSSMNMNSFFDLGMDLIINNRNLYVGMDYVDKYGINYGKTMVLYPLSIIPGLQGFVVKITDVDSQEFSTSQIITNDAFEEGEGWGLGTNLITDIYMAFGVLGVVILMFILGFMMQKLQQLFISKQTPKLTILYMIMLSMAIYLPRAEFLHPIRPLFWSYGFYLLSKSLLYFINIVPLRLAENE